MEIKKEWAFVGYGVQLEDERIGYVIVHPAPDETLEKAMETAKAKLLSDPGRYARPCEVSIEYDK